MNTYDNQVMHGNNVDLCFCMGPQNGQPLCPCGMKGVIIKNGEYVIPEKRLGPAPKELTPNP